MFNMFVNMFWRAEGFGYMVLKTLDKKQKFVFRYSRINTEHKLLKDPTLNGNDI